MDGGRSNQSLALAAHFNFLLFRRSLSIFRSHLELQKYRTVPSRRTNIFPVPGASGILQNEHRCSIYRYLRVSFRTSRAVSTSIKISPTRMGPMQFRVRIRPLLSPSSTLHFTWIDSPCIPVRPTISMISAGVPLSSLISYVLFLLILSASSVPLQSC